MAKDDEQQHTVTMESDKRLAEIIEYLEATIPDNVAIIKIVSHGDTYRECHIEANQSGYLWLGVKCLRAATEPLAAPSEEAPFKVEVPVDCLVDAGSDIRMEWLERREEFTPAISQSSWQDKIAPAVGGFILVICIIFMLIGIGTVAVTFF